MGSRVPWVWYRWPRKQIIPKSSGLKLVITPASVGENLGAIVPWSWLGVPQRAAARLLGGRRGEAALPDGPLTWSEREATSQCHWQPSRPSSQQSMWPRSPCLPGLLSGGPQGTQTAPGQKPPCCPLPWVQTRRKRGRAAGAAGPGAGPRPACVRVGEEARGLEPGAGLEQRAGGRAMRAFALSESPPRVTQRQARQEQPALTRPGCCPQPGAGVAGPIQRLLEAERTAD